MILVTGGAGYIGSHTVRVLLNEGCDVVVLDNLSTGHAEAVDRRALFVEGDIGDRAVLERVFSSCPVRGVVHFAAKCYVRESVADPISYYRNNVACSITLFQSMLNYSVNKIVFSSTCAVYGAAEKEYLDENTVTNPINPYGKSKLIVEQILEDLSRAQGLDFIVLRYFNAAGAEGSGEMGEDHFPETHLIPNVLKHLLGLQDGVTIYGSDYDTADGTCVRDYIHVLDLAEAHAIALHRLLRDETKNDIFNLGSGEGHSVKEIVDICQQLCGKKAALQFAARREGDPPRLVACIEKARHHLNWQPRRGLEEIIRSAWKWHRSHPRGFARGEHHD